MPTIERESFRQLALEMTSSMLRPSLSFKHPKSRAILVAGIVISANPADAQTLFNLSGSSYLQSFDGTTSALPVGWGFGQGVAFASTSISSSLTAGTTGAGILSGSSAGGSYHFVNGTSGIDTERSIGFLTSGSFSNNRDILFGFKNTTGQIITSLALSFDYEKYRSGFSSREWSFYGSSNDTIWGSALIDGGQFYAADLNATTVFSPPLSVTKSVTINGLSISPDGTYYFRWNYNGQGTGSGAQALGLDNLSLSATLSGGIHYWDTNGAIAGIGGAGIWDTTALNWSLDSTGASATTTADANRVLVFGGNGATVTIGSGAAANAGISFASGGYTFSGGTLSLGGTGLITISNATHTATISSAISGNSGFTKAGLGKITLTGQNTFTGGTLVSAGILEIAADQNLGAATSAVTLSGGTLKSTASIASPTGRGFSGSGALDIAHATTLEVAGEANFGDIVLNNTGTLRLSGSSSDISSISIEAAGAINGGIDAINLSGPVDTLHTAGMAEISAALNLGSQSHSFTIANGSSEIDLLLTGALTGATGAILHKLGSGTLAIAGNNTGLNGIIKLGSASASGGTLVVQTSTSLAFTGKLELHSGSLRSLVALTGLNAVPASVLVDFAGSTASALTFDGLPIQFLGSAQFSGSGPHTVFAETDVSIAGAISGSTTAFTLRGGGSLTLDSGGSFSGDIGVDGSKLEINGGFTATNRPSISVLPAGVLSGNLASGTLGALIADGGILSPGNSTDPTGVLTATSNTLALDIRSGGSLSLQLAGVASGEYDRFVANGQISLAGSLALSLINGFSPLLGSIFTIIENDGSDAVAGTFSDLPEGAHLCAGASTFSVQYSGGDGNDVTLTTIPEPSSAMLLLAGLGAMFRRRRRA